MNTCDESCFAPLMLYMIVTVAKKMKTTTTTMTTTPMITASVLCTSTTVTSVNLFNTKHIAETIVTVDTEFNQKIGSIRYLRILIYDQLNLQLCCEYIDLKLFVPILCHNDK